MQQQILLASIGALSAVCLAALTPVDTLAEPRVVAMRPPVMPAVVDSVSSANEFFVSQYRSPFNPAADAVNSDCGPACLAMALKRFFSSKLATNDPDELVRLARIAMTGNTDKFVTTDNDDVIKGASLLGFR